MLRVILIFSYIFVYSSVVLAQEAAPGGACSNSGNFIRSGGPEITGGGHFMVCDGSNWVTMMDYSDTGALSPNIDYDSGPCTAAKDGRLRYAARKFEYCNGSATSWVSFKEPQCTDNDTTACFLDPTRSDSDPDFVASNINAGTNMLGVSGTFTGPSLFEKIWQQILNTSGALGAFGWSSFMDGDTAIIGDHLYDGVVTDTGRCSVYERASDGTWGAIQYLFASDAAYQDRFCKSVAVNGDIAIVGAEGKNGAGTDYGAAYVFERASNGTWSEVQKLTASDAGQNFNRFGSSVTVNGNFLAVGANGNSSNAGAAYLFYRSSGTWTEVQKIMASDSAMSDRFGDSISSDGDIILVGATGEDGVGSDRGAAYVFRRASNGTWSEVQKLTASDALDDNFFGFSVSIDGDIAAIGATEDTGAGTNNFVYVFERASNGTWSQVQRLTPSSGPATDRFGYSVSVRGDIIAVGAISDSSNRGALYVFERASSGTWSEREKIPYTTNFGYLGRSVSVYGSSILIGGSAVARIYYQNILTNEPDIFDFTDVTGASLSTSYESDIIQITVLDGTIVSVAGDGSPTFRICDDPACSGESYSNKTTINNGEYLQIRIDAAASPLVTNTANVTVGSGGADWTVETLSCDDVPNAFDITDDETMSTSTTTDSTDTVQITGITCAFVPVVLTGDASGLFRVCNDGTCSGAPAFSSSGTVANNQYLQLQATSPANRGSSVSVTATIGGVADTWALNTTPMRVFVTSTMAKGNAFVGTNYGDTECQARADAQLLGGTYKGWISDSFASAASRMSTGVKTSRYENTNGDKVADDWTDLSDGTLDIAVGYDETGAAYTGAVWTGTTTAGAADDDTCSDWGSGGGGSGTTTEGSGADVGSSTATNGTWTAGTNYKCGSSLPIYCIEQ